MAELAAGAVSSLLGVLRNEAQLLQRIGHDVEFIKEEMESMNSFLEHLARTAPPSGSHDEQVRTWMKQVRDLAHDCSNCIDNYLHRGDPAIYRARGGFRRHIWWASWFVQELIAQHKAAIRLRELKERASDVGKRRLRYGVEIPGKAAAGSSAPTTLMPFSSSKSQGVAALPAPEDDDEDEDGQHQAAVVASSHSYNRQQAPEFPNLDGYFTEKIVNWVAETKKMKSIQSIAIVTSEDASNIAHEALTKAREKFKRTVWINLSSVHYEYDKLGPNRVLCYILLHVSKLEEEVVTKFSAWKHKRVTKREIMKQIQENVDIKIEELRCKIEAMEIKINTKTGAGNTATREIRGINSNKNEATQGGNKIIEKNGGSNTTRETGGSSKNEGAGEGEKSDQAVGRNKTEETAGGENNTDEPEGSLIQTDKPLGVVFLALLSEKDRKTAKDVLSSDEQTIITSTAKKLQEHIKSGPNQPPITLDDTQYEAILREVFLTSNPQDAQEATTAATSHAAGDTLRGDDQIKEIRDQIREIVRMVKQDILEEIQCSKTHGLREQKLGRDQIASAIEDAKNKITQIRFKIKEQMVIKGIADRINKYLKGGDVLFILEDENRRRGPKWEDIVNALKLLECANKGCSVIVTTKDSKKAKEFCYPSVEPISHSLVCLYHDVVLQSTHQQVNSEDDNSNSRIIYDILDKCHPNEFCMKMFTCALYANPNRSNEELRRLRDALQVSGNSLATNAKKIFKFSYRDLPREHKTCLLYLAVFPQGDKIRRSTLIGRWLTEGLITKEDWVTAVRHAERCFYALIDRTLVSPGDISAKGEFKSCMVGDLVHGFITKIAKKQHILDARLSHLWAHHFSIFSGIRLRASDSINMFVKKLHHYAPQLSQLKLLDLQGCQCFDKKNNYLKAICDNISFLKFLSLRETNVTHLPTEINNLHDLEILDIRQTKVREKETRHILLLKLRRLLVGSTDPSPCSNRRGKINRKEKSLCSSALIPYKIEKMENIEVLSNVKASSRGNELEDIRKLWQLRKLGVVIKDNDRHLHNLLQSISDLNECLQSLSITIQDTRNDEVSSINENLLEDGIYNRLIHPPKLLESVSINGLTNRVRLLSLLAKGSNELAKISLCGTMLHQKNLKVLAHLPKLRCVRLRYAAYNETKLTFNKEEFEHLKYLIIDGKNMTDITFKEGAAVELETIILSSTNVKSLCGVGRLARLKGLELKGNESFDSFSEDEEAPQQNGPVLLPKDEAAPQKNLQHVSPSEDGTTPQKSIEHVSPSENGANQESTEHVSAPEDGATRNAERKITFRNGEFPHLKYFLCQDPQMINIIFEDRAVPELEKIILHLMTSTESQLTVSGSLPKLKEIELKGGRSTFLSLFEKTDKIDKLTLYDTLLNKDDLGLLAKKPSIFSLLLLDNSYNESHLTFNKDEFPKLNLLVVKCSVIKSISFNKGSVPNLEKIIWSFSEFESLSGIDNVEKLKELELDGDVDPSVKKEIRAHKNKPVLVLHKKPRPHVQEQEKELHADSWFRRFSNSCFSKEDQH